MNIKKCPEELNVLVKQWHGSTEPCDPRAVYAFSITRCRLVRWDEAVNTPSGQVARMAVILEGYVEGPGKRVRLYLVEPDDVAPFYEALCNVVGGAIVTATVPIALKPLGMSDVMETDGAVTLLLGRRPDARALLKSLGEFELTR